MDPTDTAQLPAAMDAETNNSSEDWHPETSVPAPHSTTQLDLRSGLDIPLRRQIVKEVSQTNQKTISPGTQKAENVLPISQEMNDVSPSIQEIRDISLMNVLSNQKIEEISASCQQSDVTSSESQNINNVCVSSNDTEYSGKIQIDDSMESHKEQNGIKLVEKVVKEEKIKTEPNVNEKDEEPNKKDVKREEDKDLRKYNKKIPEERAAVQKDKIEEHFDK